MSDRKGSELLKSISVLLGSVVATETLLMLFVIPSLPARSPLVEAVSDALLLGLAVLPFVYFFSYRPMVREVERERELHEIIDGMNDAVFIHRFGDDFLAVNDEAVERLGYSEEELLSMSPYDINPESRERTVEEQIEEIQGGTGAVVDAVHETEEGERIPVEISSKVIEYRGEEALLSVARDITDRLRREDRLEYYVELVEELEDYHQLFENIPIGVYRTSLDGEFQEVNPAMVEMFDAESREELMERSIGELYTGEPEREAVVEELIEEGEVRDREVELRSLRGRSLVCSLTAVKRENDVVHFDGILQDVTKRREVESREERIGEKLDILDRLLRHDLRNDLNVIEGDASMLREEVPERLVEMVEEILDVAEDIRGKVEKGRFVQRAKSSPGEKHRIDLSSVVRRKVREAERSFPEASFETDIEEGITGSVTEGLGEVVSELLENAVIHNDGSPEVEVSLEGGERGAVLEISDDGPGTPVEELEPIRSGGETQLDHTSGIGLWTVKWYVDANDGRLDIGGSESGGTRVRIELAGGASSGRSDRRTKV